METNNRLNIEQELNTIKEQIGDEIIEKLRNIIAQDHANTEEDLLHLELSIYKAALSIGRDMLEKSIPLIYGDGYYGPKTSRFDTTYSCVLRQNRKLLNTVFGQIDIHRAYYQDDSTSSSLGLLDMELGIHKTLISPGLSYYGSLLGTVTSYQEASDTLRKFGMCISDSEISKLAQNKACEIKKNNVDSIMDITLDSDGRISMANIILDSKTPDKTIYLETDGCHVPIIDGEEEDSDWTECKTMLLFEKENDQVKNKHYFSTTQRINTFKRHVKKQLETYCGASKVRLVVLGDGAKWIWNMARELVPNDQMRTEVLDWYHVKERIIILAGKLFPDSVQATDKEVFVTEMKGHFRNNRFDVGIKELNRYYENTKDKEIKEYIYQMVNYFDRNRKRMNYKFYEEQGISIGSGAIESANKYVVQRRIKIPGARWTRLHADQMAQLRAEYVNGNFDRWFNLKDNPMLEAVT